MPTYEYRCKECGEELEVVQSFTDDALTVCPTCAGPLRKVFGNIGVTFKGSGFYRTDSRPASTKAGSNGDSGGGGDKVEAAPAKKDDSSTAAKGDSSGTTTTPSKPKSKSKSTDAA